MHSTERKWHLFPVWGYTKGWSRACTVREIVIYPDAVTRMTGRFPGYFHLHDRSTCTFFSADGGLRCSDSNFRLVILILAAPRTPSKKRHSSLRGGSILCVKMVYSLHCSCSVNHRRCVHILVRDTQFRDTQFYPSIRLSDTLYNWVLIPTPSSFSKSSPSNLTPCRWLLTSELIPFLPLLE